MSIAAYNRGSRLVAREADERMPVWRTLAPGVASALVLPAADGRCHRDGYDAGWARVRRLAGIDRPVRWHDLRHMCASHLAQGTWGRAWTTTKQNKALVKRPHEESNIGPSA